MLKRVLCSLDGVVFLVLKENGAAQVRPGSTLGLARMQLWTVDELDGRVDIKAGVSGAELGCPEGPGP